MQANSEECAFGLSLKKLITVQARDTLPDAVPVQIVEHVILYGGGDGRSPEDTDST